MRLELNIGLTLVIIASFNSSSCLSLRDFHYEAYECDDCRIPDFEKIKPLRLVEVRSVKSRVECTKLCTGNRSVDYPLFAMAYSKSENMTSWTCQLLTTIISEFSSYEIENDLKNVALTPFCGIYFPQGQMCDTLRGQGHALSWINLWPNHPGVPALCDFDTDGGSWTVIQRRLDGSEDFNQGWNDYKFGFGSLLGEFWFGLENIRAIVKSKPHEIRFDMRTVSGLERYAVYQNFWFEDESQLYQMSVGSYSGNAGDSFSFHNNCKFDANDFMPRQPNMCPERFHSGFWFRNCHNTNPNGLYGSTAWGEGINWNLLTGYYQSLVFIEMKLRPMT